MRDANQIIQQITDAFSDTERPSQEALFNDHCWECARVSAAYAGKRWSDVSLDDVQRGLAVELLSAVAWRYYLPALMIWTIRAPEAVDVLQDNLVYQLEPPKDGGGVPEWFEERATGFSTKQRLAVVAYLEWYRDREEMWRRLGAEVPRHIYNALSHWTTAATGGC